MVRGIKKKVLTVVISFGMGLIGCIFIYKILPQILCQVVQDVHSSNLYQNQQMLVEENIEYVEFFVPQQYSYLKQIALHITREEPENKNDCIDEQGYLGEANIELMDSAGYVLKRKKIELSDIAEGFVWFPVEGWVTQGEEYCLKMTFANCDKVYLTCGPNDIGPMEHQMLQLDGKKSESALYTEYVYGSYSKKLLLFWLLVLFILSCLMIEEMQRFWSTVKQK